MKLLKMFCVYSILSIVLVFINMPALAEYYQYIDKDGNTAFTDDISNMPQDQAYTIKKSVSKEVINNTIVETNETGFKEELVDPNEIDLKDARVVYYNKKTNIKILNYDATLFKIIVENGVEKIYNIGMSPDAYPEDYPAQGTRVDSE